MKIHMILSLGICSLFFLSCDDDGEVARASNTDLVINEIQPSNTTTATDQDGEYDDWIELYNLSADPVDISGFFMSDNVDNLTRWRIPEGTTIGGNGYLIVWADGDISQTGLHADFKLSGSGEELYLLNPDVEIVDEVVFGEQVGETSYARSPNGTGDFVWGVPTFETAN